MINQQILLINRPIGLPKATDFELKEVEIATENLQDNEVLIQNHYISLDPAMRGWMRDVKSYAPPVKLGSVMRALSIGKIIASQNSKFQEGEIVAGVLGVQSYAISSGRGLMKIDQQLGDIPSFLHGLGMTGMTAYFGLLDISDPQPGKTLVVSGAAGAVGSLVGQIAKIKGCRVVGIAGSERKCQYIVNELGFDAAINYKTEKLNKMIKQHCPDGVDIYFDNVGGETLNTILRSINLNARIIICGAISQYNATEQITGPSNYMSLLVNRARMEGFLVSDYYDRYPEAIKQMSTWIKEGKIKTQMQIIEGIESFHEALLKLFSGDKFGKLMLKVSDKN